MQATSHPQYPIRNVLLCNDSSVRIMSPTTGDIITSLLMPVQKRLVDAAYAVAEGRTTLKGALYGIEPSTRNSKIWSTREEAAPSVPKNILLNLNQTRTRASHFQSITDVSTTALSRITFKSHELKIATTVITRHACLVSCCSFVHRSAAQHRQRQQDIFRY